MKATRYILMCGVMAIAFTLQAQVEDGALGYYNDALMFSQTNPLIGSTARMQGFGGAQASLGGDISVVGANPAGIGFFNRSVFSITPGLNFHSTDANYLGNATSSYKTNFNIANVGIVLNNTVGDVVKSKFKGGSFAISLHRMNDFQNEVRYQGRNDDNSIIDAFLEEAGTTDPDNLGDQAYSAYNNYLINPVYNGSVLEGYDAFTYGYPNQTETINTGGGQYQLNLAWGGNYNDRLYFGGALGINTLSYYRRRNFREDQYEPYDSLNSTQINDELNISGSGINVTLGLIARPVQMVTVGVSYVSPTYYALNDEYGFTHRTSWNNAEVEEDGDLVTLTDIDYISDLSISNYNLKSPSKLTVGTSVFFGKFGFVTGDIEFVDYANAQLRSNDFNVNADNQTIENLYKSVINYRLGAEARLDAFRIRGGYSYMSDPFSNSEFDNGRRNLTAGVGYRQNDFFIEGAWVNTKYDSHYSPYTIVGSPQPVADIENRNTSVVVTVGFNF